MGGVSCSKGFYKRSIPSCHRGGQFWAGVGLQEVSVVCRARWRRCVGRSRSFVSTIRARRPSAERIDGSRNTAVYTFAAGAALNTELPMWMVGSFGRFADVVPIAVVSIVEACMTHVVPLNSPSGCNKLSTRYCPSTTSILASMDWFLVLGSRYQILNKLMRPYFGTRTIEISELLFSDRPG